MNPIPLLSFGISMYLSIEKSKSTEDWRKKLDANIESLEKELGTIDKDFKDISAVLAAVEFDAAFNDTLTAMTLLDQWARDKHHTDANVKTQTLENLRFVADALSGETTATGETGHSATFLGGWLEANQKAIPDYERRPRGYFYVAQSLHLIISAFRAWDAALGSPDASLAHTTYNEWLEPDNAWSFHRMLQSCQAVLDDRSVVPAGYGTYMADEISFAQSESESWEYNRGNRYQLVLGTAKADEGQVVVGWELSKGNGSLIGIAIYQGTVGDDGFVTNVTRKDAQLDGPTVGVPEVRSTFHLCSGYVGVPTGQRVTGIGLRHHYVEHYSKDRTYNDPQTGMPVTLPGTDQFDECWIYLELFTDSGDTHTGNPNGNAKLFADSNAGASGSICPQPVLCGEPKLQNPGPSGTPDPGPWTGKYWPMRDAALCMDADRNQFLRPYATYDLHLPKLAMHEEM